MELSEKLKKIKDIRRLFGERELAIIEKQLRGVRLKASEKTRLSRDIRKKFEAIKELIPFVEEFDLKHGGEINELIKEAKEILLESKYFPRIKEIILFGSAVENRLTLRSDIDIAVKLDIEKKEVNRFRLDILKKVDDKVDIQVYNSLPKEVRAEIDEKGKAIWRKGVK